MLSIILVDGTARANSPLKYLLPVKKPLRSYRLKRGNVAHGRIAAEQLVQRSRSAAPMSDDENRRFIKTQIFQNTPISDIFVDT